MRKHDWFWRICYQWTAEDQKQGFADFNSNTSEEKPINPKTGFKTEIEIYIQTCDKIYNNFRKMYKLQKGEFTIHTEYQFYITCLIYLGVKLIQFYLTVKTQNFCSVVAFEGPYERSRFSGVPN